MECGCRKSDVINLRAQAIAAVLLLCHVRGKAEAVWMQSVPLEAVPQSSLSMVSLLQWQAAIHLIWFLPYQCFFLTVSGGSFNRC